MARPLYLTTTLPYVNADPHIGFALEIVHADIVARYNALAGRDVFFNTGTDEHGMKIHRKSEEMGKETKNYVDEYAGKFKSLKEKLNLHPELHFIRTTDATHKAAAQELWKQCEKNGDIYKKKYKGLYCVGDEAFMKESDLTNGTCPNHPNLPLVEIEEENYFFRLSAYQEKLLVYLQQDGVIVPEWRRLEAVQFVERGLEDFSISRVKEKMPWGIAVPGDESQVMYVWFDALTNYISTLGWPDGDDFEKYWNGGEVIQMAGKDQVRFQSIMWQAMLMSARIKNTDKIVYHGFITSGGKKMSKSLGNVIDPYAIVEQYGVDALRFFLARHIHPFEDSDFTMERFKEAYNADLANGLGNLTARILRLSEQYLGDYQSENLERENDEALSEFNPQGALEKIWSRIKTLDQKITTTEPFKVVKSDLERGKQLIEEMRVELAMIARQLAPFLPETSHIIGDSVRANKKPENMFLRK